MDEFLLPQESMKQFSIALKPSTPSYNT